MTVKTKKLVAPSILSADFANLGQEIERIEKAGADWIHVDVMDGHFVDNITMGPAVVNALQKISTLPLDVHLMIENPEKYIEAFAQAGARYLTVLVETTKNMPSLIHQIRSCGVRPGITLRPRTPFESIHEYLPLVDLVLIMTVEPGFSGQSFMTDQVSKIHQCADFRIKNKLNYLIEVDGGINQKTAALAREADVFVAGHFVFKNDYQTSIHFLKELP